MTGLTCDKDGHFETGAKPVFAKVRCADRRYYDWKSALSKMSELVFSTGFFTTLTVSA
jgi:hypothetical protein